ncbi:hypothetical protein VNO80_03392 [Phaseolus coccineus]|uniref:Uncharacterized protein n=1 Tax=Phaseolus coccineus TaxID=3886 RepID=A0AAN9RNK2_PHACN
MRESSHKDANPRDPYGRREKNRKEGSDEGERGSRRSEVRAGERNGSHMHAANLEFTKEHSVHGSGWQEKGDASFTKEGMLGQMDCAENTVFSKPGKVNSECKRLAVQNALLSLGEAVEASFISLPVEDVARLGFRAQVHAGRGVEAHLGAGVETHLRGGKEAHLGGGLETHMKEGVEVTTDLLSGLERPRKEISGSRENEALLLNYDVEDGGSFGASSGRGEMEGSNLNAAIVEEQCNLENFILVAEGRESPIVYKSTENGDGISNPFTSHVVGGDEGPASGG